jgi:hypothetical protein
MGLECLKGTGQWSGDPACLWIPGLNGLGGAVQQNGDPQLGRLRGTGLWSRYCAGLCRPGGHRAGLCRPWEHGLAEQRLSRAVQAWERGLAEVMNVYGSPALRAHMREILQV